MEDNISATRPRDGQIQDVAEGERRREPGQERPGTPWWVRRDRLVPELRPLEPPCLRRRSEWWLASSQESQMSMTTATSGELAEGADTEATKEALSDI